MQTIFKIIGGGQKVRQCADYNQFVEIIKEQSDWPERSGVSGQDFFTGYLWATDLETVKANAREWAGRNIRFKVIDNADA